MWKEGKTGRELEMETKIEIKQNIVWGVKNTPLHIKARTELRFVMHEMNYAA